MPALERSRKIQRRAANVGFDWQEILPVVSKIKEESETSVVKITVEGYAYSKETNPLILSRNRANSVWDEISSQLDGLSKDKYNKRIKAKGASLSSSTDLQSNRRVRVTVQNDALKNKDVQHKNESLGDLAFYPEEVQLIDSLVIDENGYFEFVDANFPNYFSTISEKIKYFHPGFH